MDKKAQIQELIALGNTEKALELLGQLTSDAVLLQNRYNSTKKQYNMGMIDFSEWSRAQTQINFAALEIMNALKENSPNQPGHAANNQPADQQPAPAPKVFVSYSHKDKAVVDKIVAHLKANQIEVLIDRELLKAGKAIQPFIEQSIKNSQFVLSIVSANSLKSGWVSKESLATHYAEWLDEKYFLPARLDDRFFDPLFQVEAAESIHNEIKSLKDAIKRLDKVGGDPRDLQSDIAQLTDLKNNLPKVVRKLKETVSVDLKEDNFAEGLNQIVHTIKAPG